MWKAWFWGWFGERRRRAWFCRHRSRVGIFLDCYCDKRIRFITACTEEKVRHEEGATIIEDDLFLWFLSFGVWVCSKIAEWEDLGWDKARNYREIRKYLFELLKRNRNADEVAMISEQEDLVDRFDAHMATRRPTHRTGPNG